MTVRIGEISYTNISPLFHYLNKQTLNQDGFSFIPQVPAQLNAAMAAGTIDIGGISSFAYGENQHHYTLLPNLSVSSYGDVRSLFLFSKVPIEQLHKKSIALTSSSATTVHLLKIILKRFYELDVSYEIMEPNYERMLNKNDACLLIGDDAIMSSWNKQEDIYQYDLGQLWYKFTSLPMTFAVIAVRNETIEHQQSKIEQLYEEMLISKQQSFQDGFKPMINQIKQDYSGSQAFWEKYFHGLTYDFSEQEQKGLLHYFDLCYELGYLHQPVHQLNMMENVTGKTN
ncbi:menaquinone biosynthesis protein [Alkalihalobacillus trypoxylicola]|uniref:Chorismate dehydratase n=1 Tax=Alkalihalobacillus trypoxylicola TaxID=519424 RepID=A0A162EGX4_9BACI|nr:menaquinone biosynthesis protein [Alkalihalobacillus trypoxylicola]KYG32857.1 hypothetical protein AZF04_18010 [Alkalihalobacillus trypoxylicola]